MARGDHIRVKRPQGYWHHGIDCGDGTVFHYTGELFSVRGAHVCHAALADFTRGAEVEIVDDGPADPDTVIRRAESRLGERAYSLLLNNCEHFARWCRTGRHESRQVRRAVKAVGYLCVAGGIVAVGALAERAARRRGL